MKLKTIIYINEWISHSPAVNRHVDSQLRAVPGGQNDGSPNWSESPDWDGIVEGNKGDWFAYIEGNDWEKKVSGASVYITEDTDKPYKIWIKIKTHGLKKKGDTNETYKDRVRKHTKKVAGAWMSAAKKLHEPQLNEVGNEIPKTWRQSFHEALNDPKLNGVLAESGEKEILPMGH